VTEIETMLFFERIAPISTGLGGDIQMILSHIARPEGYDLESLQVPFVGYHATFTSGQFRNNCFPYKPALFKAVPPGHYKLSLYSSLFDKLDPQAKGYYEKEVTIPEGTRKISLTVPYQAPSKVPRIEPVID